MDKTASQIIHELGGTTKVAKMFGIQPPSVSEWKEKNAIPEARLMYIRVVRPDIFSGTTGDDNDDV